MGGEGGHFGHQPRKQQQIFHQKKSHDFDSLEHGGAKVKGVEEIAGEEADSADSMG